MSETFRPHFCTICGKPIVPGFLHACRGQDIPLAQPVISGKLHASHTEQAKREAMLAEKDVVQQVHIERINTQLISTLVQHELSCPTCSYWIEQQSHLRCVECRTMQDIQKKWQERIKA
jgi:hypothetical protein